MVESIDWVTYVFTAGVSVEYPSGWAIVPSVYDFVDFRPPTGGNYSVRLEVYDRPLQNRATADPHSWEGNEGGYEVHWEKPISIQNADGLEFIWGVIRDNQWEGLPFLMAVYYSEQYELDVRLTTAFDSQSAEMAQTLGLTDTISTNFGIFDHMVQSVHINQ